MTRTLSVAYNNIKDLEDDAPSAMGISGSLDVKEREKGVFAAARDAVLSLAKKTGKDVSSNFSITIEAGNKDRATMTITLQEIV